jgi:hypothetical protein
VTTPSSYAGGVAGQNNGANAAISACYNIGAVSGTSNFVGGVAGGNSGANAAISDCYNTGAVTGSSSVGGVVGRNAGEISACYNTGAVSGSSSGAGGVAGNNNGAISDCYNTGAVTTPSSYAGGVAGQNSGANAAISACYNIGAVSGTGNYVGGVAGNNYNSGTVTNSYCLDLYGSTVGTQLTADEMRSAEAFEDFDFTDVWAIDANLNGGYPYLRPKPVWKAGDTLSVKNLFAFNEIADIQVLADNSESLDIRANFNFNLNHIELAAAVYDENGKLSALYRADTGAQNAAGLTLSGVPKDALQKNMQIFIWDSLTLAPYIEAARNF